MCLYVYVVGQANIFHFESRQHQISHAKNLTSPLLCPLGVRNGRRFSATSPCVCMNAIFCESPPRLGVRMRATIERWSGRFRRFLHTHGPKVRRAREWEWVSWCNLAEGTHREPHSRRPLALLWVDTWAARAAHIADSSPLHVHLCTHLHSCSFSLALSLSYSQSDDVMRCSFLSWTLRDFTLQTPRRPHAAANKSRLLLRLLTLFMDCAWVNNCWCAWNVAATGRLWKHWIPAKLLHAN